MSHGREDAPRRYPYNPLVDLNYDEALDELKASEKDGRPHIPTFARRMLERLRDVGLLHTMDTEPPVNVRKVTLDKGQELWIRFDTYRDIEGYMAVALVDAPRSDAAILAAMVAWLAQPIDFESLLEARRVLVSSAIKAQEQKIEASMKRIIEGQDISHEGAEEILFRECMVYTRGS
jgi:hypothetical protein